MPSHLNYNNNNEDLGKPKRYDLCLWCQHFGSKSRISMNLKPVWNIRPWTQNNSKSFWQVIKNMFCISISVKEAQLLVPFCSNSQDIVHHWNSAAAHCVSEAACFNLLAKKQLSVIQMQTLLLTLLPLCQWSQADLPLQTFQWFKGITLVVPTH